MMATMAVAIVWRMHIAVTNRAIRKEGVVVDEGLVSVEGVERGKKMTKRKRLNIWSCQ